MKNKILLSKRNRYIAIIVLTTAQVGCASTYSNLVSGNNLGAQEYKPSVYVPPENQVKYESVLPICRQVAVNRQITSAQEAQLKTITGVTEGAADGLSFGLQFAGQMKNLGFEDASVGDSALIGAAAGIIGSLGSVFASGAEDAAAETKEVLLNCIHVASNDGELWQVLE